MLCCSIGEIHSPDMRTEHLEFPGAPTSASAMPSQLHLQTVAQLMPWMQAHTNIVAHEFLACVELAPMMGHDTLTDRLSATNVTSSRDKLELGLQWLQKRRKHAGLYWRAQGGFVIKPSRSYTMGEL